MKKLHFLVLAVAIIAGTTAGAQTFTSIKMGLNSGYLSGFEGRDRLSGHIGLALHHRIDRNWSIQPEILFSGEGQVYISSDGEERTLALDYVQLPLMFQYHLAKPIFFEFGPQLGLLVSARDKGFEVLNVREDFAPAQLGLNLGIGLRATANIGFYGRYAFGLSDVSRFDNIVDQSRVGQLGMTIRLR